MLYQIELPSVIENVGFEPLLCVPGAACYSLHHILISNPNGNRTRASGATVRRTRRYTMRLCFMAAFWGYVLAGRQRRQIKRPPVWLDKRQSQQLILEFVWSSHGSLWSTWSQTSTWSGHIKAYTNKPFRILDGRHNCFLKIKHAICIFVCSILQHCLSFPDLLSFFLRLIYHLRFGLSFNLWYKLVTGTVPMSPHVTLCLIYYYLRNKLEKSSALRLKKHI